MTKLYTDSERRAAFDKLDDESIEYAESRDRSFGPTVQAVVNRATSSSSTITPSIAAPLTPFQRAELECILQDMDLARERLRKLLG